MTNTTQTYWDINGTSLNTYAYNISTLGDGRTNMPALRGSNVTIPYRRGDYQVNKIADSRDITLSMWISGNDVDGAPPADANLENSWQENLDTLRRLVWSEDGTVTLTKRFWRSGVIVEASAEVECIRGLDPSMLAVGLARATVTFNMPDPFFYGVEVEESFVTSEYRVLNVAGDVKTTKIWLDLNAGVELVNYSRGYAYSISSDEAVFIDVSEKQVNNASGSALITTSGSDNWFLLNPGTNTIRCNNDSATMYYQPAYF